MHGQAIPACPLVADTRREEALAWRLLNDFQRDFPLQTRPFGPVARTLGCSEAEVRARLAALQASGAVSRVGPVFSPRRVGASTLAALQAPPERLDEVAAVVSGFAGVNHNYAREHDWNLWFVATAPDSVALARSLREIHRLTRCPLITLPLETEYHIDLGFDLADGARVCRGRPQRVAPSPAPGRRTQALMAAIQQGIPLLARPYQAVARHASLTEAEVLRQLRVWLGDGTIKRFGVVVRHHELGWRTNAMCVWDVPDAAADEFGRRLAACDGVHLCYRRRRAGRAWPFNLYCMLHGRERAEVHERLRQVTAACGLAGYRRQTLFSTRRFKQCGARYAVTEALHG